MTSSAKSTKGIPLGLLVLAVAGVGLFAGWAFVLWHHRFRITAPVVFLMLGWMAVLSAVYFLWRTADNADLDDHADWWQPTGRLEELVREKRSLLKAIKETEHDRDTGKLSPTDAGEMMGRYRQRAIDVIKAIEDATGGAKAADVRDQIEREVRARLEVDRKQKKESA